MSDPLLDKIELILDKVEVRVLEAFLTLLERDSMANSVTLPQDFRVKVRDRLGELRRALEQTGNVFNLQLATERHDDIRLRIYILDQLIDKSIPVGVLNNAELDLDSLAARKRGGFEPHMTLSGSSSGKSGPNGPKEIYQENGIYAVARQLAWLASEINIPGIKKPSASGPKGKASFQSKDVASEMDRLGSHTFKERIAQSPEEIRRKLEARARAGSAGKASFGASELRNTIRVEPQQKHDPFERLKNVKPQLDKGKAVFASKDIHGVATSVDELKAKLASKIEINNRSQE